MEKVEKERSNSTIIILPDGARAIANIPLPFIEGNFKLKLEEMLKAENGLVELNDVEYSIVRELFLYIEKPFKILLGIPGVDSPRSFLSEDNYDLLLSYSNLEFTPESESSKFMKELETLNEVEDDDEE